MPGDKPYHDPSPKEQVPAASLHQHVEEVIEKRHQQRLEERRHWEEEQRRAYFEFLHKKFDEVDRQHVKALIREAVHAGKFEAEILRFPANFLDDHGRAISNGDADWPKSLTGYAASCYEAFNDLAKPLGYRLIARILDYPGGMIGNIGLIMEW